jgi:hypothetical protein
LPPIAAAAVVVATSTGDVLALSAVDGSVLTTIATNTETGGPPGHLSIAPDRRAVFFDRGPTGCWLEFSYLGGPGVSGNGSWPSVSANGARVATVTGTDPCRPDVLAVADIGTGQRREWRLDAALRAGGRWLQGPLSWSADGRRLTVVVAGSRTREVRVFAIEGSGAIGGTPLAAARPGGVLHAAFFTGTEGSEALVTLEACCGVTPTDWQLARRTLRGTSLGPARDTTSLPGAPLDVQADRSGQVAVATRDGALFVGALPTLRRFAGRYVAAAR